MHASLLIATLCLLPAISLAEPLPIPAPLPIPYPAPQPLPEVPATTAGVPAAAKAKAIDEKPATAPPKPSKPVQTPKPRAGGKRPPKKDDATGGLSLPTLSDSDKAAVLASQLEVANSLERVARNQADAIKWDLIEKLSTFKFSTAMAQATVLRVKNEASLLGTNFGTMLFSVMYAFLKLHTDVWTAPTKRALIQYMPNYLKGLEILALEKNNANFDYFVGLMQKDIWLTAICSKEFGEALQQTIDNDDWVQSARGLASVWQKVQNNFIMEKAGQKTKSIDVASTMKGRRGQGAAKSAAKSASSTAASTKAAKSSTPAAKDSTAKQSEAKKGDAKTPETKASEPKQGDAKQPEAKEGDAKQPAAKEGDAKQPDAKTSDAKQPEAKEGDAKQPAAKEGDAKQPAAKEGDAKQPAA